MERERVELPQPEATDLQSAGLTNAQPLRNLGRPVEFESTPTGVTFPDSTN